jgi:hypothetical protein
LDNVYSTYYDYDEECDKEISIFDFVTFEYEGMVDATAIGGAEGNYSFTTGVGTRTMNSGEVALGRYNQTSSDTLLSVGNGDPENPNNAFKVDYSGNAYDGTGTRLLNQMDLPSVTSEDDGKFLRVVGGVWKAVPIQNASEVDF